MQELNVTGSSGVTDDGVDRFLGKDSSPNLGVRSSLRLAKLRSTGVRSRGVRAIIRHCTELRGIR